MIGEGCGLRLVALVLLRTWGDTRGAGDHAPTTRATQSDLALGHKAFSKFVSALGASFTQNLREVRIFFLKTCARLDR
jgi:hypothetical protein